MTDQTVSFDEIEMRARARDLASQETKEVEQRERAKKNHNFYMVFKTEESSKLLRKFIAEHPAAANVFLFLAELADRTNAVVASGKALSTALNISESTISRAIKYLVDNKALERLNSGGTNVFILNPNIIWSAWKTGKGSCMFGNARVLVSTGEQDKAMQKRLNVMMVKSTQSELFDPDIPLVIPPAVNDDVDT